MDALVRPRFDIYGVELHHIDEAIAAAAKDLLPADVLARLNALYESDFGKGSKII